LRCYSKALVFTQMKKGIQNAHCFKGLFLRRERAHKPQPAGFLRLKAQTPGKNALYEAGMEV